MISEFGSDLATALAAYLRERSTGGDLASKMDEALLARMLEHNKTQRSFSIFGVQIFDGTMIRDDFEPYPDFLGRWMAKHHALEEANGFP